MSGSPAPPPPLKSNSNCSAPAFESNGSGPSPGHELAHGSSTSPAAAVLPVAVPSDALVAVLGVVSKLRARGLLAGFEIPEAELTDEGVSALFDGVLTAFLAELAADPAAASCLPIPPPPLGDGQKLELVSLFLAVRARGGFSAVESWAAVAEAVGLDPTADTAVKLLYGKYLALLEQSCGKHMVVSSGNADLLLGSNNKKERCLAPTKRLTRAGSAQLKRKRDELVGMLDWIHLVAKNPGKNAGKNAAAGGHKQAVVELRRQMFADKDCLAGEELVEMLNWVRSVATSVGQPGIIGMSNPPDHLSTAVELRRQMSVATAVELRRQMAVVGMLDWVRRVATSPAEPEVMEGNSLSHHSTALLFRSKMFADKKDRSWSAASSSRSVIPLRPCGQADIPEWTGKPASSPYYDDPRTLRFLGEPILLPGSTEDPDGASIGKGRQDDCNCEVPGSIACVRFHVAEKKIKLKDELGSAYFEMGFHRIGEDLALTWTKDEESKFNTIIQNNLPSSTYKFWDKLLAVLRHKGREGLVSYYHNVFQVWRRAYQNRLGQNVDSDDDSIEPGFLYARQLVDQSRSMSARRGVDQSRSKSAGSSRKRRRS